jgi:MFS family permease
MYYFPIMSLAPAFFDRHRGFAMGFILAGGGAGGLALAPVLRRLIDLYGVGWALRVLGLWNLVVGIPVACVIKRRDGPAFASKKTRLDMQMLKKGTFLYQVAFASSLLYLWCADFNLQGRWWLSASCWKYHPHLLYYNLLDIDPVLLAVYGQLTPRS